MSNPNNPNNPNNQNNPFLSHLTEENNNNNSNNNNENQNDNNEKNNDISKILEEGEATAIPPPAYNEIVKPEPTQAGFDYPSYPPPPFPAPEVLVGENNYPTNVHMNSNERRGSRAACCCAGSSRRNKTCSCGWMIVLIVLVTLGILSIINNSACNNISVGPNPVNFNFDASTNAVFRVNADEARIRRGEVRVFQRFNDNNQVNIEVYTGTTGITPKFDTFSQGGVFELKISQPGFSIFNIPSRCMRSQINVYLPEQLNGFLIPYPNTIQVKNQDIIMMENDISYRQNITLITVDGDVWLNGVRAQNLFIKTDDGNVFGNITSVSDELNILTDNGNLFLTLGNAQTPFTSRFTVLTDDGDVKLKFDGNSFSGNYNVQSYGSSSIQIDNSKLPGNKAAGTINSNIGGDLKVTTDDGDVDIKFQAV